MRMKDNAPTFISQRRRRWTLLLGTRAVICMCSVHTEVEAVKKGEKTTINALLNKENVHSSYETSQNCPLMDSRF